MSNDQRMTKLKFREHLPGSPFPALALGLLLGLLTEMASGQESPSSLTLSRNQFRSGEKILQAFSPISAVTRDSIVKFHVDGRMVALGTVVDGDGLAVTKASEINK